MKTLYRVVIYLDSRVPSVGRDSPGINVSVFIQPPTPRCRPSALLREYQLGTKEPISTHLSPSLQEERPLLSNSDSSDPKLKTLINQADRERRMWFDSRVSKRVDPFWTGDPPTGHEGLSGAKPSSTGSIQNPVWYHRHPQTRPGDTRRSSSPFRRLTSPYQTKTTVELGWIDPLGPV